MKKDEQRQEEENLSLEQKEKVEQGIDIEPQREPEKPNQM
ncbi:3-methyladenine DNA glycosylase [Bacillus sp. REN10]|nr:3-methyladenine DNA glycosylase [Bacillus sp. REN10]